MFLGIVAVVSVIAAFVTGIAAKFAGIASVVLFIAWILSETTHLVPSDVNLFSYFLISLASTIGLFIVCIVSATIVAVIAGSRK